MIFEVFTDGSSFIDGPIRASSSAYKIYLYNRPVTSGGKFFVDGTNNSGETYAVLQGLKTLDKCLKKLEEAKIQPPIRVRLYTDSLITRDACTEWIYKWLRNARKGIMYNSGGEPVVNQEIFRKIHDQYLTNKMFDIQFFHLNSHIIERRIYQDNMPLIRQCISNLKNTELHAQLPAEIFEYPKFIKAKETFAKKNKLKISNIDLLRLLVHNMDVDKLASDVLNEGLEEQGLIQVAK